MENCKNQVMLANHFPAKNVQKNIIEFSTSSKLFSWQPVANKMPQIDVI